MPGWSHFSGRHSLRHRRRSLHRLRRLLRCMPGRRSSAGISSSGRKQCSPIIYRSALVLQKTNRSCHARRFFSLIRPCLSARRCASAPPIGACPRLEVCSDWGQAPIGARPDNAICRRRGMPLLLLLPWLRGLLPVCARGRSCGTRVSAGCLTAARFRALPRPEPLCRPWRSSRCL